MSRRLHPFARGIELAIAHDAVTSHVDRRSPCESVQRACRQSTTAPPLHQAVAFQQYLLALDTDEAAARAYAQIARSTAAATL